VTETTPPGSDSARDRADAAAYRLIVENAADLIVRADSRRTRTFVSPSSRELLGFEPDELLGRGGIELVHPDDIARATETLRSVCAYNPRANLVFRMRRKDGTHVWVEARYRYLAEDGGLVCIIRDISAQKATEERLLEASAKLTEANAALQDLALRDGLTGVGNRRYFEEALQTAFLVARREHEPLGLLMIDIDNFKAYNDRYGHIAGDACLRRVAATVAQAVRRPSDIVTRYGGEEFAVVLAATDLQGAMTVGEQVRLAVEELGLEHSASRDGVVSVSIGAGAVVPMPPDRDPVPLLRAADEALYCAKAAGRNRVCSASVARVTA
jgi:diguanylate cyclase (GGDEF)-like protein/PAS domain S-box-containing protein